MAYEKRLQSLSKFCRDCGGRTTSKWGGYLTYCTNTVPKSICRRLESDERLFCERCGAANPGKGKCPSCKKVPVDATGLSLDEIAHVATWVSFWLILIVATCAAAIFALNTFGGLAAVLVVAMPILVTATYLFMKEPRSERKRLAGYGLLYIGIILVVYADLPGRSARRLPPQPDAQGIIYSRRDEGAKAIGGFILFAAVGLINAGVSLLKSAAVEVALQEAARKSSQAIPEDKR